MPDFDGSVVFTVEYHGDTSTVTIDQADPHVLVNDEVLNQACTHPTQFIRMEPSPHERYCQPPCAYPSHPFCWTDWLLHLDIPGRHLIYRIGKYRLDQNAWEASWPD